MKALLSFGKGLFVFLGFSLSGFAGAAIGFVSGLELVVHTAQGEPLSGGEGMAALLAGVAGGGAGLSVGLGLALIIWLRARKPTASDGLLLEASR